MRWKKVESTDVGKHLCKDFVDVVVVDGDRNRSDACTVEWFFVKQVSTCSDIHWFGGWRYRRSNRRSREGHVVTMVFVLRFEFIKVDRVSLVKV